MWCGACVTFQPKFQQRQCFSLFSSYRCFRFHPLAAFLDRFLSRSVATEKLKVLHGVNVEKPALKARLAANEKGIDEEISAMVRKVMSMTADVAVLKTDFAKLKTDSAKLKADVAELKAGVAELKAGYAEFDAQMKMINADNAVLNAKGAEQDTKIAAQATELAAYKTKNDAEMSKLRADNAAIKIQFERCYVRQLVTQVEECVLGEFDPKYKFHELNQLRRAIEDAGHAQHKYAVEQFGDADKQDFMTMCDVFNTLKQGGNEVAHPSFKDVAPATFANNTVVPALHKANVSAAFVSRMVSVFDQKLEKY